MGWKPVIVLGHQPVPPPDRREQRRAGAFLVNRHQHARLRGYEQVIEHVMVLAENRVLHVEHGKRRDDEASQGDVGLRERSGARRKA